MLSRLATCGAQLARPSCGHFLRRGQSKLAVCKPQLVLHASSQGTPQRSSIREGRPGPRTSKGYGAEYSNHNGVALETVESFEDIEYDQGSSMGEDDTPLARVMDTAVKIYCVHTEPNYSLPWQNKRQYASTSSGFIIWGPEGQRWLLTNAHSVEYHSQVKVKRRGDDIKYIAQVLAVGVECDIALLTVEDDAFWEDAEPLAFGELPCLQDPVAVVGYPIGGDTISVTSGVVSRIEVTSYAHGASELLGVQIDAAINSGNSGGPVINQGGECVGIAFQSMAGLDAENIGYVIPTPVIFHFLTDFIRNGTFTGFPILGVQWQRLESAAIRAAYKMEPQHKGVLVRSIAPCAASAAVLKKDDIIMRFDGVQVTNDGTVPFRTGERIAFTYLISQKYTGETAQVEILRDGKEQSLEIELSNPPRLVPCHIEGKRPQYLLVSGLVFTVCCEPYLENEYGADYGREAPVKLLDRLIHGQTQKAEEQVVVLSQVLACDATLGYEDIYNVQVKEFNGVKVDNLVQLQKMVATCTDEYMRFGLEYNEVLILKTAEAMVSTNEVMEAHAIPFATSLDLRNVPAKSV